MTNKLNWAENVSQIAGLLSDLSFRDGNGEDLPVEQGFVVWQEMTEEVRGAGRTIFLAGNGASASMASHLAADLAKNAHMHTQVFTDLSLMTAISNDIGYESVFSEPLRRRGRRGDMLVLISSSGRSRNVLNAAQTAEDLGVKVMTLSAMDEANPLRSKGCLNAHIPARTYGLAETCHAAILHHWMDLVENSA